MQRRSGCIWIGAGLVLAIVAGVVTFSILAQAVKNPSAPVVQAPMVGVLVAARPIGVRQLVTAADVEVRQAPADLLPESALRRVDDAVGRIAIVALSRGEMLLSTHVISPTITEGNIAWTMDKDKVAMAFPANDLMTRNNLLKPGDHVDVFFSLEVTLGEEETDSLVTFSALQNLEIAAIVYPGALEARARAESGGDVQPLAIVFALDPQDALVLKHLRDRGGVVDMVLRAPDVGERFTTAPVNLSHLVDRYQFRIPELP